MSRVPWLPWVAWSIEARYGDVMTLTVACADQEHAERRFAELWLLAESWPGASVSILADGRYVRGSASSAPIVFPPLRPRGQVVVLFPAEDRQ